MTLVMTSLPLARVFQCLFTFALVSASRWLAEIWQLSRRGATGELEVEFKFQRRSCKLSFLFPPCHQSALETLLTGYFLQGLTLCLLLLQNRIPDRNDAAAVQQFFMEEIQIGEDLIHQGPFSSFCFWVGGHFLCWLLGGYKKEQGWCKALTSSQFTRHWTQWHVGLVCWWFSPLHREVILWVVQVSLLIKNQHFQIPVRPGMVDEKPLCGCATSKSL